MKDYKELLADVRKSMPEVVFEKDRFEIPKVRGHLQGSRTIISNFAQIAATLRRDVDHLLKYILREIGNAWRDEEKRFIYYWRKGFCLSHQRKIRQYADTFVFCSTCGKPDTKLDREGQFTYMKCQACGSRSIVKSKI